jgi:hypothetical protein
MSGFEGVGVVLGVLPLVISALQSYSYGVQTIRRMLRYKWELDTLITTLETEEVLFRNTCEVLLDGIDGPVEMEELLKTQEDIYGKKGYSENGLRPGYQHRMASFLSASLT